MESESVVELRLTGWKRGPTFTKRSATRLIFLAELFAAEIYLNTGTLGVVIFLPSIFLPTVFNLACPGSITSLVPLQALQVQRIKQAINFALAVGERIESHADPVEQGQMEVGQGRWFVKSDMSIALHSASRTSGNQNWKIRVIM